MAHELDMSITTYLQIKDKLIPKHLAGYTYQRSLNPLKAKLLS